MYSYTQLVNLPQRFRQWRSGISPTCSADRYGAMKIGAAGFGLNVHGSPGKGGGRRDFPARMLICLGNMPNVTESHLAGPCATATTARSRVASFDGIARSPPCFIERAHFDTPLSLKGDDGARAHARCLRRRNRCRHASRRGQADRPSVKGRRSGGHRHVGRCRDGRDVRRAGNIHRTRHRDYAAGSQLSGRMSIVQKRAFRLTQ